jgi:hypothetical protein
MKAAPVWPTSHHNESLQQQAIPIQNNEWSVLKLHVKRNLQIIQSLESFEPDSSAARAFLRRANWKQMLPSKNDS